MIGLGLFGTIILAGFGVAVWVEEGQKEALKSFSGLFLIFIFGWLVIIDQLQEQKRRARQEKLKWSSLMGPICWNRASEIAKLRDAGWRLPTAYELENNHFRPRGCLLWLAEKNTVYHSDTAFMDLVDTDHLAHCVLVREG